MTAASRLSKGAEADAEQRIDLLYAGSGGEFSAHSLLEHLSVGKVSKRAKLHVKKLHRPPRLLGRLQLVRALTAAMVRWDAGIDRHR